VHALEPLTPTERETILDQIRQSRAIVFAEGAIGRAATILGEEGWEGYALLGTERSLAQADPAIGSEAAITLIVPPGPVPDSAAAIIADVSVDRLVAVGGGQVVDVAKAIAAAKGPDAQVAAIPTTLAGSTSTRFHRFPTGYDGYGSVRPAFVIADPEAMCSAPAEFRLATAANALAHATDCLFGAQADAATRADALRAIELIVEGLESGDHERLGLGALAAGDAIDRAGFGLQHALAQSTVAASGSADHARVHAAILPHSIAAQLERRPQAGEGLAEALGGRGGAGGGRIEPRLSQIAGSEPLESLGVDRESAARAAEMAAARPEASAPPEGEAWGLDDLLQVLSRAGAPL
jgi:alcohol dehydrogenase class IV